MCEQIIHLAAYLGRDLFLAVYQGADALAVAATRRLEF